MVSFKIMWKSIGRFNLKKVSASPEVTDGNDKYSLEGAVYGVYDEDGGLVQEISTDAGGFAAVLLPYGEYSLRELKSPIGYLLDEDTHKISIEADDTLFEHREEIVPEKTVRDNSPQTGDCRNMFVFAGAFLISAAVMAACLKGKINKGKS